ncbi:unnamed protein product, partial [Laminaria digitata]
SSLRSLVRVGEGAQNWAVGSFLLLACSLRQEESVAEPSPCFPRKQVESIESKQGERVEKKIKTQQNKNISSKALIAFEDRSKQRVADSVHNKEGRGRDQTGQDRTLVGKQKGD